MMGPDKNDNIINMHKITHTHAYVTHKIIRIPYIIHTCNTYKIILTLIMHKCKQKYNNDMKVLHIHTV